MRSLLSDTGIELSVVVSPVGVPVCCAVDWICNVVRRKLKEWRARYKVQQKKDKIQMELDILINNGENVDIEKQRELEEINL